MSAHLKLAAVAILLSAVAVTSGSAVTIPASPAVKKAQRTATAALKQSIAAKKATTALSRRVGKLEGVPVPVGGTAPAHLPSVQVVTATSPFPPGTDNSVSVTCPAGTVMTGGGGSVSGVSGNVLTESGPRALPNVWFVSIASGGPVPHAVTATAFCMTP